MPDNGQRISARPSGNFFFLCCFTVPTRHNLLLGTDLTLQGTKVVLQLCLHSSIVKWLFDLLVFLIILFLLEPRHECRKWGQIQVIATLFFSVFWFFTTLLHAVPIHQGSSFFPKDIFSSERLPHSSASLANRLLSDYPTDGQSWPCVWTPVEVILTSSFRTSLFPINQFPLDDTHKSIQSAQTCYLNMLPAERNFKTYLGY